MRNILAEHLSVKVNIELFAVYIKKPWIEGDEAVEHLVHDMKSFSTRYQTITKSTDLKDIYDSLSSVNHGKAGEFQVKNFY